MPENEIGAGRKDSTSSIGNGASPLPSSRPAPSRWSRSKSNHSKLPSLLEPRRVPRLAGAGDRHGVERREPVDQRAPGGLKRLARRRRQGRERVDPAVMRADTDRLEKLPTIEQMGERERQHRLARVIGVTVDRAGGEGETVAIGGADRRLVGEAGGQAREGLGDLAMGDEVEGDWLALDDGLERNAAVIAAHRSLAEPEAVDALATRQH